MFVAAALTLCAVLTVLNLILTLGVIRRLRDHTDRFTELAGAGTVPEPIIGVGTPIPSFTATSVTGERITDAQLAEGGMVGFFSTTCSTCEEWAPRFASAARSLPGGRSRTMVVVVAPSEEDAARMTAEFEGAATVVREVADGPLATAFKVFGYPAMCRVGGDGTVAAVGRDAVTAAPVTA
ncbi:peroxiredoxin family protein [Planomonospora parontospora]|uniref:peroxiredoxin family protein n=1 Tax=Planomonospora parontospora TaxID=58119 RepID=UPI00167089FA|nr:hypothetical protein [Planomonospora parontospora]GGL03610.1 hypothetical protein GCM10014719_02170 [Planomonospora parontospora subsp. antibiotica]GII13377.1 hypothetical protein Ppa05_01030 [Planomonospora parontospora subsp. antibiotica]